MSDEEKRGGRVVHQLLEKHAEPQAQRLDSGEAELTTDSEGAFPEVKGTAYALFKMIPRVSQPTLELRFITGRKMFLNYAFIDAGDIDGGLMEIEHSRYLMTLKGRNLLPLFEAVRRARVEFIQATDPIKDQAGPDTTVVYEITIKPSR